MKLLYLLLIYYIIVVVASRQYAHGCYGFRLFKLFRWQVELWVCPPWIVVPLHKHQLEHTTLWFLKGSNTTIFKRDLQTNEFKDYLLEYPKVWFRKFYLSPMQYHGFRVNANWLVFLNFQRWLCKPTSAAKDFIKLQPDLKGL